VRAGIVTRIPSLLVARWLAIVRERWMTSFARFAGEAG